LFVFPFFFNFFGFPSLTLPFYISPLLLLQARKYLIAHNTGTVTIARAMTEDGKKRETSFPTAIN
jgi:urea transporter